MENNNTNKNNDQIQKGSKITETGIEKKNEKHFDKMNNIIAHLLSNLTWFIIFLLFIIIIYLFFYIF